MVTSSQVKEDLNNINKTFTTYKDAVNSTKGIWEGASSDNFNKKTTEFISEFKGPINTQMTDFASALDLNEQYEKIKDNCEFLQNSYEVAVSNDDAELANKLKLQLNSLTEEKGNLAKKIEELLSKVISAKLSDVGDLDSIRTGTGEFVNYYQYNYSDSYGYGSTIASSGCGPTSMAMVLKYFGEDVDPVDTANWSLEHGYRVPNNGTAWAYFDAIAEEYGIECEQAAVNKQNVMQNLEEGKVIIMSMGPGHFTKGGHFIVLTGIDESGKITVADPSSEARSNCSWDLDVFLREGKQLWSF